MSNKISHVKKIYLLMISFFSVSATLHAQTKSGSKDNQLQNRVFDNKIFNNLRNKYKKTQNLSSISKIEMHLILADILYLIRLLQRRLCYLVKP